LHGRNFGVHRSRLATLGRRRPLVDLVRFDEDFFLHGRNRGAFVIARHFGSGRPPSTAIRLDKAFFFIILSNGASRHLVQLSSRLPRETREKEKENFVRIRLKKKKHGTIVPASATPSSSGNLPERKMNIYNFFGSTANASRQTFARACWLHSASFATLGFAR